MDFIKQLRFETNAPIVECRKALIETNNDMEAAKDWLREHGSAKVQSKNRAATDGLVGLLLSEDGKQAGFVKVAAETDFSARSKEFVDVVACAAKVSMQFQERRNEIVPTEDILQAQLDGHSVKHYLDEAIVAIRENLSISTAMQFQVADDEPHSFLTGYVHNRVENDHGVMAGTAGAVVELERVNHLLPESNVQAIGRKLAMHIVAVSPLYLNIDDIPQEDIDKETDFITQQLYKNLNEPQHHMIPKIAKGKLKKYFTEVCLSEQKHAIEETIPRIGAGLLDIGVKIKRFHRLGLV